MDNQIRESTSLGVLGLGCVLDKHPYYRPDLWTPGYSRSIESSVAGRCARKTGARFAAKAESPGATVADFDGGGGDDGDDDEGDWSHSASPGYGRRTS